MLSIDFVVFAYFSPETFLPLTSVIASAVGVFLLFGSTVLRLARRALRTVTLRGRRAGRIPTPHFRPRETSIETLETADRRALEGSALVAPRSSGQRIE
jgi:hypothetical protein